MDDWEDLLKEASRRVQRIFSRRANPEEQRRVVGVGASGDKTLAIDRDAEAAAIDCLLQAGDVRIVSEEKGEVGSRRSRWTVLLDPVDGSSNFERGIPFYCTSFAVVEGTRLRETKYALVRNLVNGETFYAERGRGAKKNNKVIATSSVSELPESVVAIDVSRASSDVLRRLIPLIASVKRQVHLGANALELCLLAEGKVEAFVDVRGAIRVTDLAGGRLIVKEAGGMVTTESGGELDAGLGLEERQRLIASGNETLHKKLVGLLR